MMELEPVSKFRKEAFSKIIKTKQNIKAPYGYQVPKGYGLEHLKRISDINEDEPYELRQFEDSHHTQFIHEQISLITLNLTLLATICILLSFMQAITSLLEDDKEIILGIHSLVTVALVIMVIFKHFKTIELKTKQLIRDKQSNKYWHCFKSTILEISMLVIHPNLLTKDTVLHIGQPAHSMLTPFHLNNMFQIVILARVYLIFNCLVETSIYCTPRAHRMCRIYNAKDKADFAIKSLFNAYPLQCLFVLTVTLISIQSRMLMLSDPNNESLQSLGNAMWFIIITMSTVGYGDINTTSYLGRLISFTAAISGIILASLLILTLSQKLAMNSKESKSHITLKRLQLRKLLQHYAQQTIAYTSSLTPNAHMSQELKKKTERVKQAIRRLKNMVDTDNLSQEINTLFDSLYGNLMEIYIQQTNYAEQLVLLQQQQGQHIQDINFTFAAQIENIIKQR